MQKSNRPYEIASSTSSRSLILDDSEKLKDQWRKYLELLERDGTISSATKRTYEIALERFEMFLRSPRDADSEIIHQWIARLKHEGRSVNTIGTWLSGVRSFYVWGVRNGKFPSDPTQGIAGARRRGERSHIREPLSDDEIVSILDYIDTTKKEGKRDIALIAFMAFQGARTVEAHRARFEDLKKEKGFYVLNVQGKGRPEADAKIVIVNPEMIRYLDDYIRVRGTDHGPLFVSFSDRSYGKQLSKSAIRHIVKGYMQDLKITGRKSTHSLRHSAATNALLHGAPITKIQSMLRHMDISTTMIYAHDLDRVTNPGEQYVDYRDKSK